MEPQDRCNLSYKWALGHQHWLELNCFQKWDNCWESRASRLFPKVLLSQQLGRGWVELTGCGEETRKPLTWDWWQPPWSRRRWASSLFTTLLQAHSVADCHQSGFVGSQLGKSNIGKKRLYCHLGWLVIACFSLIISVQTGEHLTMNCSRDWRSGDSSPSGASGLAVLVNPLPSSGNWADWGVLHFYSGKSRGRAINFLSLPLESRKLRKR